MPPSSGWPFKERLLDVFFPPVLYLGSNSFPMICSLQEVQDGDVGRHLRVRSGIANIAEKCTSTEAWSKVVTTAPYNERELYEYKS